MASKRILLQLTFQGGAYSGWQGRPAEGSVKWRVENALNTALQHRVSVAGCCVLAKGMHAARYFLHFDTSIDVPENLPFRINALLPRDIRALSLHFSQGNRPHAGISAERFTWRYHFHFTPNPFLDAFSHFVPLNSSGQEKMQGLVRYLDGLSGSVSASGKTEIPDLLSGLEHLRFGQYAEGRAAYIEMSSGVCHPAKAMRIAGLALLAAHGKITGEEIAYRIVQGIQLPVIPRLPSSGMHLWNVEYTDIGLPEPDPLVFTYLELPGGLG